MRYASVCSGIEAPTVAWHPLGWRPQWFSEIDAFPSAALAHHYPDVPNRGDMTQFKQWGIERESIDLLVGGTPCQSLSVAGLRKGLADPRGNLALVFLAIADAARPRWVVWENVPGVLSSGKGRDFGAFLGGLVELGYGFAYRVLDAQYYGVAQRRRRVFVVGHLGDWRPAAAVLFERDSLSGNPAPRREKGKGVARPIAAGSRSSSGYRNDADTADNLIAFGGNNTAGPVDVATACNAHGGSGRMDFESETFVAFSCKDHGADAGDIAPTLRAMGHAGSHANAGGQVAVAFDARQSDVIQYGEKTGPLDTDAFTMGIHQGMAVRRLTPRECERLQGFPDVREEVTISLCIGRQKHDVSAALSCRRWQSNVSPADAQEWPQPASVAASNSTMRQAGRELLVVVSVHTSSAGDHLEIRNHGRLIWSANTADVSSASRLPTLNAVIAAELAQAARELALAIRTGKAESLQSIRLSTQVKSGATSARRSGDGREASARGAAAGANLERFTTFTLGLLGPTSDSKAATSLCSVLAAISGCIPSETLPARFSLLLDLETPYTLIPYRNKPAADGPRYKALGNSMAVPVVRWLGERIQAVDAITKGLGHG